MLVGQDEQKKPRSFEVNFEFIVNIIVLMKALFYGKKLIPSYVIQKTIENITELSAIPFRWNLNIVEPTLQELFII